MDAIKVVTEEGAGPFERRCNELASQGYIMQACHCGFFNPNVNADWTPRALWYAVFALPEYAQQSRALDTAPRKATKK